MTLTESTDKYTGYRQGLLSESEESSLLIHHHMVNPFALYS